jgi:Fe-S oxidoreductase
VGERLAADVADREGRVAAEGASCCQQLRDRTDRRVCHPLELLAPGR